MNKKNLIILIVILAVILLLGFFVFKCVNFSGQKIENSAGGVETENPASEQNNSFQAQTEGENVGGLSVCLDKCGDGVCQKTETCPSNSNCICAETQQECPQDCK